MVPAATPKPVIARLNAEINAILKQPDVVEKMNASGFDLIGGTPEDFGNLIKRETETWTPVIRNSASKSTEATVRRSTSARCPPGAGAMPSGGRARH